MAGGKLPPRQKMIGMMYLVLTALLAMNVSKDILDAFVIINDGIETTNSNFKAKNEFTYTAFDKALMNDREKVKPFHDQAQNVRKLADELDAYIVGLKKHLITQTSKVTPEIGDTLRLKYVGSKDNYDIPSNIMIGEPSALKTGEWSASELKGKISSFREQLMAIVPEGEKEGIERGLQTDDFGVVNGTNESWETGIFYHVPLAAVVTALSKIQADVRNAEADVIKSLYSNISAEDFKFDTLAAKVIPNTNYVIIGDTYKADVFVAAFSSTQDPQLLIGEVDSTTNDVAEPDTTGVSYDRGVAKYAIVPSAEGETVWGGVIKIKKPDGTFQPYPFESKFMAAKPTLVVSPTAMNVFYRGLDNPVEISVPGVPTELLKPSVSNGSISPSGQGKGKYIVRPGKGKTAKVSVSAELNGENKNFGEMEFRCKNVPSPAPYFGGITGSGNLPRVKLIAVQGILAKMENFEFDLKFTVVSFSMSMNYKGNLVEKKARGNKLTGEMKDLLKAAKKGNKIFIEQVKAKGPDGTVRDLGAISIKVV